uniref:Uncharacterized protein n=1 Tax=Dictyoglomus thermophilum TaxID=14 RepID=A0A7C3RLT3_DICTH
MLNLFKYGILGKKRYYLIITIVTIGVYISLFIGYLYFRNLTPEDGFVLSFILLLVSIILNGIFNITSLASEDMKSLYYSIPINPKYIYIRRMLMGLLESLYILILNLSFMTIIINHMNPAFKSLIINYLQRGGIYTIILLIPGLWEVVILASTFPIANGLPSEKNPFKRMLYMIVILILVFGDKIRAIICKWFPYSLNFNLPQFNFESITGSLETSISVSGGSYSINIFVILFDIIVTISFLMLNSWVFEKKMEIK